METKFPEKREVLEKASQVLSRLEEVELAVLFGSAAKGGSPHDVDLAIAVKPGVDKLRVLSGVVLAFARALGMPEDRVDVVDLDRAGIDLKREVVRSGVVLVDRGNKWGELIKEATLESPTYSELLDLSLKEWLSSPNPPSSINPEVVKRRLEFARGEVDFLKQRVLPRGLEVERSPELRRLLERGFQLVVEAMLDVCRHVVSAKGWGPAYTHADCVERLRERGGLPERVSSKLLEFIGIRNVIIHRYLEVDYSQLRSKAEELGEEFERWAVGLLKAQQL